MSDEEEEMSEGFSASEDEWKPGNDTRGGETSDDDDSDFEDEPVASSSGGSRAKKETKARSVSRGAVSKKRKPLGQSLRTKLYNKYRPPPKIFGSGGGANSPSASNSRTASKNVQTPNESRDTGEDSSSESSVDDYLVNPADLDLHSSFFNVSSEKAKATSPAPIFDCNVGVQNLSNSGSEDDNETSNEEHAATKAFDFRNLLEKANSLERAKESIAKRTAETKKRNVKDNANSTAAMDVNTLLALGEKNASFEEQLETTKLTKTKSTRVKRHTKTRPASAVITAGGGGAADSDDSEFEEVADDGGVDDNDCKNSTKDLNRIGSLEIHVELPGGKKRTKQEKQQEELELAFKRKLNRDLKERQLLLHKASLLCCFARSYNYNKLLNDTTLMQAALKLLPSKNAYPPERGTEIKYFQSLITWFKTAIKLTSNNLYPPKVPKKKSKLRRDILEQIKRKEARCRQDFVFIFVILARGMGLQCRLIENMQPLPLRPSQADLITIKTKKDDDNKKDNNKETTIKSAQSTTVKKEAKSRSKTNKNEELNSSQEKTSKKHSEKKSKKAPIASTADETDEEEVSKTEKIISKATATRITRAKNKTISTKDVDDEIKRIEKVSTAAAQTSTRSTRTQETVTNIGTINTSTTSTTDAATRKRQSFANKQAKDSNSSTSSSRETKGKLSLSKLKRVQAVRASDEEPDSKRLSTSWMKEDETTMNQSDFEGFSDQNQSGHEKGLKQKGKVKNLSVKVQKIVELLDPIEKESIPDKKRLSTSWMNEGETTMNQSDFEGFSDLNQSGHEKEITNDLKQKEKVKRLSVKVPKIVVELRDPVEKENLQITNVGPSTQAAPAFRLRNKSPKIRVVPCSPISKYKQEDDDENETKNEPTTEGAKSLPPHSKSSKSGTSLSNDKEQEKNINPKQSLRTRSKSPKVKVDPSFLTRRISQTNEMEEEKNVKPNKNLRTRSKSPKVKVNPSFLMRRASQTNDMEEAENVKPNQNPSTRSKSLQLHTNEAVEEKVFDSKSQKPTRTLRTRSTSPKLAKAEKAKINTTTGRDQNANVETKPKRALRTRQAIANEKSSVSTKLTIPQLDGADDLSASEMETISKPKRKSNTKANANARPQIKLNKSRSQETENSDDEFEPSPPKRPKQAPILPKAVQQLRKDRRVISTDDEDKNDKTNSGVDFWVEIWSDVEEHWVSIDLVKGKVHSIDAIRKSASSSLAYVFAFQNDLSLKDVTARYCPHWTVTVRKSRVEKSWLDVALAPYIGRRTKRDIREDQELRRIHEEKPLPTAIGDFKDHPLYALERHLLKFQAIYPVEAPTLGFIRGEPIYARECVHTLHSREIWLKQARTVKLGEQPYKIVKARPKWDRLTQTVIKDQPLEIFGYWQTQDYEPPTAEDGVVPRNAYGNVELFKECMLPKKTVHLRLPGLNRICRKLGIDCASAVVGFDFHQGACHPTYDGFIVCEEFGDQVVAAWHQDQEDQERKDQEKYEARVYGNWKKLIRGLLIRERLKKKYNF